MSLQQTNLAINHLLFLTAAVISAWSRSLNAHLGLARGSPGVWSSSIWACTTLTEKVSAWRSILARKWMLANGTANICTYIPQYLPLCIHHHHQVRVLSENRSVVLAPWSRRTTLLHRSAGQQIESCQTRSSHLFLGQPGRSFQCLLKRRLRDASIWQHRARRAGTLSASRAKWPKAAVCRQAICSASGPTPAWDSISELVMCWMLMPANPEDLPDTFQVEGLECLHISDVESRSRKHREVLRVTEPVWDEFLFGLRGTYHPRCRVAMTSH